MLDVLGFFVSIISYVLVFRVGSNIKVNIFVIFLFKNMY